MEDWFIKKIQSLWIYFGSSLKPETAKLCYSILLDILKAIAVPVLMYLWYLYKRIKEPVEIDAELEKDYKYQIKAFIPTRYQENIPDLESKDYASYFEKDIFDKFNEAEEGKSLYERLFRKYHPWKKWRPRKQEKNILILADSGMGKTTLLEKLFLNYRLSFINVVQPDLSICLYRIHSSTEKHRERIINNKKQKNNTILLLDSLDEYDLKEQDKNPIVTLKNLYEKYNDFKATIITCRTQYISEYINDIRNLNLDIKIYYMYPFTEKEAENFISQKVPRFKLYMNFRTSFPWFDVRLRWERDTALKLFRTSEKDSQRPLMKLFQRPMLLSHIRDLVEERYQINIERVKEIVKEEIKDEESVKAVENYLKNVHSTFIIKDHYFDAFCKYYEESIVSDKNNTAKKILREGN